MLVLTIITLIFNQIAPFLNLQNIIISTILLAVENKKQLHHCINVIRNRTSILLNIISEHNHN